MTFLSRYIQRRFELGTYQNTSALQRSWTCLVSSEEVRVSINSDFNFVCHRLRRNNKLLPSDWEASCPSTEKFTLHFLWFVLIELVEKEENQSPTKHFLTVFWWIWLRVPLTTRDCSSRRNHPFRKWSRPTNNDIMIEVTCPFQLLYLLHITRGFIVRNLHLVCSSKAKWP
jgi:hypothetical protein